LNDYEQLRLWRLDDCGFVMFTLRDVSVVLHVLWYAITYTCHNTHICNTTHTMLWYVRACRIYIYDVFILWHVWVMSHIYIVCVRNAMYESCRIYIYDMCVLWHVWVILHIYIVCVRNDMYESCNIYIYSMCTKWYVWGMSHIYVWCVYLMTCMSHVAYIYSMCTKWYVWVMSHIYIWYDMRIYMLGDVYMVCVYVYVPICVYVICMSHVAYIYDTACVYIC